jgi:hypothetical protein
MQRSGTIRDKRLEDAVHDLLKSRARSRIYVYLQKKMVLEQNKSSKEQNFTLVLYEKHFHRCMTKN